MKRPAVFFDRDNTLIVSDGYLGDPSKVVLVEGAADAVSRVRSLGYAAVVVSNQSGVARGMFPEEAVHAVNARLDEMLLEQNPGAVIDRHEFCPYHPDASQERYRQDSELRKPRPGMIYQAAEKLALDLSRSWVVGDAPRDIEAGHTAGCRTILLKDPNLTLSMASHAPMVVEPDYLAESLREATDIVARETLLAENGSGEESGEASSSESPGEPMPVLAPVASEPEPMLKAPAPPTPFIVPPPVETAPPPVARVHTAPAPAPMAEHMEEAPARAASQPEPAEPMVQPIPAAPLPSTERLEELAEQILQELRRRHEEPVVEFSVSKLLAGIVQVMSLAALFFAYLHRDQSSLFTLLMVAVFLQTWTIALLIMGRQK